MLKIHTAMQQAMREVAAVGIAKDKTATLGGANVKYRGVEAAMNTMSGILIKCGITVSADYSDLQIVERVKGAPADGKATRFVTIRGAFTFTSVEDGSNVTFACFGEAMDSGDKATTKAQSVAFRTALFQAFVVPYMAIDPEEDGDGDDPQAPGRDLNAELRKLIADMKAKTTDAETLDFWKEWRGEFENNAALYQRFKDECLAHRKTLADSAAAGAQA